MSVNVHNVDFVGNATLQARCDSQVMNPNGAHEILVVNVLRQGSDGGLDLMVGMRLQSYVYDLTVMHRQLWTPDQLADVYELAHHKLHGVDDRGLDPREGPTRLTVRQPPTVLPSRIVDRALERRGFAP